MPFVLGQKVEFKRHRNYTEYNSERLMMKNRKESEYHGLTINSKKHPIYKLRERLMYYCYRISPTHTSYPYYRGKGIKVCDEWIGSVKTFYDWCINTGWQKGLSIDRIDSNGNYEPSNCRFITKSENSKKARLENDQSGEKGSASVLNEQKVKAIRVLLKLGFKHRDIAKFFGVGKTTISSIFQNKTWKGIE